MSCLKLYAPETQSAEESLSENSTSLLLKFHRSPDSSKTLLERARRIYRNRACQHCSSVAVVPLELGDGLRFSGQYSLAGTGTLVGFRCLNCQCEWQA